MRDGTGWEKGFGRRRLGRRLRVYPVFSKSLTEPRGVCSVPCRNS
jgi:hypothetical protein